MLENICSMASEEMTKMSPLKEDLFYPMEGQNLLSDLF